MPPPPLPVLRPIAPPPPPPAPRRRFSGLALRVGALVLLAFASVAVGALALPAVRKAPANEPTGSVAESTTRAGAQPARSQESDPGDDRAATPPAAPPLVFDTPKVQPRLPEGPAYTLARQISREVQGKLDESKLPASPLAGDAEFIRRAYLDIAGRIPPAPRVVAFLDDSDPLKRAKLIDELLASPEYGRHFARTWADILIKRDFDNNKNRRPEAFIAWLAERFNRDTGWDQIVRDMITATGEEGSTPQTFFILAHEDNRQVSPSKLTASVGNLFMGIQIQCAECHQHPYVSQWGINDFWGMAAFFAHTKAARGLNARGKRPAGPATIREVESSAAPKNRKGAKLGPAIRAGLFIAVPDPNDPRKVIRTTRGKFFEGEQPSGTGKAPYRPQLARWLTAPENRYFARAAVNRTWAHFFARGLVQPIEDMGPQNRPTHPALLRDLSQAFVESKYSLKELIRAICNSEPYQRTSRPLPDNASDDRLYSHMPVKVMEARVLLDSLVVVTGQQRPRPAMPRGKEGLRSPAGRGGDPLVRFFDTREYDDDPTEFSYGIPQMLRLMNTRLSAASDAVAQQLVREHKGDAGKVLEELFLRALARRPSESERQKLLAHVAKHQEPARGHAGVLWALLNCAEFVSNH